MTHRHSNRRSSRLSRCRAMSLVEITITVAIVGIMASVGLTTYGNITERSKDTVARNLVDTLNKATRNFSHANWDLRFNAVAASAGDEMLVLRSLQWREPDGAANQKEIYYKGPYMRNDWNPATSSDTKDWRIQWTGSAWKLLLPETAGAGIKVNFEATDLGAPYVFPDNFTPVGSR